MASIKMINKVSDKVRVKKEPNFDSQSISETKTAKKVKDEMQTFNSQIEVKAEEEEKFSSIEEFINKISIAFLNEETTTSSDDNNQAKSNEKSQGNKQISQKYNIDLTDI